MDYYSFTDPLHVVSNVQKYRTVLGEKMVHIDKMNTFVQLSAAIFDIGMHCVYL